MAQNPLLSHHQPSFCPGTKDEASPHKGALVSGRSPAEEEGLQWAARFERKTENKAGLANSGTCFCNFCMDYVHLTLAVAGLTLLLAAYAKFVIVPGLKHLT